MFQNTLASISVVLGCALVIIGGSECNVLAVAPAQLAKYTGGEPMYCADPIIDPNGVDCNECVAVTGGSEKCANTYRDELSQYHPGQFPAALLDLQVWNCNGQLLKYTSSDCTTGVNYNYFNCLRQYDYNVFVTYTTGVSCP